MRDCQTVAAVCVVVLAGILPGCVMAEGETVVPGDGYFVSKLEAPRDRTCVFLSGQHSMDELPASVHIANLGFVARNVRGDADVIELARREGSKLKADFVLITSCSGTGITRVIGLSAYRLKPARLGWFTEPDGTVMSVNPPAVESGIQIGDRVMTINGVARSASDRELFGVQPGDPVRIDCLRGGAVLQFTVVAVENPPTHLALVEATDLGTQ